MRPTRPADDRRARHEATGEWPQPTLSTLLTARAQADPDRPYLIEGLREGGRTFTFRDVARARRSHRGGAAAARSRSGRRGVVAATELDRVRRAGGGDRSPRRGLEPDHHDLPRARGRLRLPPGRRRACSSFPAMVRGVDHRELARAVRAAAPDARARRHRARRPGAGAARARVARGRSRRRRCRRRRTARTTWRRSSTPPGTTADPKGVLHTRRRSAPSCTTTRSSIPPSPDDVSLLQFPLTHIGGIVMFVMLPLRSGSSVVLHGEPTIPSSRST